MEQIFHERVFSVPNLLTLTRIALLPVIAWTYRMGDMFAALTVYLLAMLTDVLDGFIAKRTNRITALGQLLDPLADKLTLATLLALLYGNGGLPGWVLLVLVAKEAVLMVGSVLALRYGLIVAALPLGKAATAAFTIFVAVSLMSWMRTAQMAMYLSVALSLAALAGYAVHFVSLMNESKRIAIKTVR